ncbi:hypothetical protein EYZ11_012010 [Aspergillus tanneri]|uniref:Grh/CP2 DB domain-containing protein n=1 Tax=Aspergillus tanneri TaxID=1220188 RepID=A0A4S3J1X2_9EURO|nr:uncharacterized protein ATNIH1004_007658 [Aspergillus tanneri]KAA8646231.1 hypothetical protein ATNIH1004_007658 [Aspergillus tanneri]THC88542.1 hypothetical protein EYZ11_012010 [Aspergillus tanneri]
MFNNRQSTQKPDGDLIERFQKTFPCIVSSGTHRNAVPFGQVPAPPITPDRVNMDDGMKLNDNALNNGHDMRFAQSFVDPSSLSFFNSLSQQQGYYTPNSGALGAVFRSQAGDLHTPVGMSLMSPLSLPQQIPGATLPTDGSAMGLDQFNQQYIPPHFHNPQPFAQQATFGPGALVHRDSGYDAMDDSVDELSLNDVDIQGNVPSQLVTSTVPHSDRLNIETPSEKFRYHITLRAPTAMVKDQDEIPVSYLNKGQAYSISVADTAPPATSAQPTQYRTYIRVSFQDKEQRSKPASCWQLWKEGRGFNEAHQRGGKLQAVEFVDPIQGGIDDQKTKQIQLESSSFDGFCVTWAANQANGPAGCTISVRFNFLSTDFSHSKGVKGIPVRLCAKTEMVSQVGVNSGADTDAEVCYCKVKLFRDHGAERKLSNDIAHVKKSIEKLRQQIAQAEIGAGNYSKRKRSNGSMPLNKNSDLRPSKVTKHRRAWSMSSQDGPDRMSMEDDLHVKLSLMQEMFTSTRPVSILSLRGDEQDDPDLFPVHLPDTRRFSKKEGQQGSQFGLDISSGSRNLSPMSGSISPKSPFHLTNPHAHYNYDSGGRGSMSAPQESLSDTSEDRTIIKHPVKVQRVPTSDSNVSLGFIEAVDIDPSYRPPAENPPRPIACFYVRFPRNDKLRDNYYRAVYLTELTVRDLMEKISLKQHIDPRRIVRVLLVKQNGMRIMVDDDVVRELPDGQDMIAEISEASVLNSASGHGSDPMSPGVEVKLTY